MTICSGVDGFELPVDETGTTDQKRQAVLVIVQEMLEAVQTLRHLCRWWRDKRRISRTSTPNPVLGTANFPWGLVRTASPLEQDGVNFPD